MNGDIIRISVKEPDYPGILKNIFNPPESLYVRGTLPDLETAVAIAVIGTRSASPYGIRMARSMACEIAACGAVVVTGLSSAIDAAAAEGAMAAGGRVIAVLGTPVGSAKSELAEKILRCGALVSEYPEGTVPKRAYFRARNRIAAGLSSGVVVIEAPEKSGTRLFVAEALDQGKEIFAVPGNADSDMSTGTLQFIKEGAKLVTHGWEIAEEFPLQMDAGRRGTAPTGTGTAVSGTRSPKRAGKNIVDKKKELSYIDITERPAGLSDSEAQILHSVASGSRLPD